MDLMDEEDYRDCSGNPGTSGILFKISSYSMILVVATAKNMQQILILEPFLQLNVTNAK
jgi:hypothetical protein